MAIKSFPYSSVNNDRKITASEEAKRLDLIAGSGVIFDDPLSFKCKTTSAMNVEVEAGSALIAGHAIISDAVETVTLDANNSTFSRVDLIVLESDENTNIRAGHIRILKGTAAETPVEPSLNTTTGIVQIKLAKILIPATTVNLSEQMLTDMRSAPVGKHTHTQAQLPVVVSNMYQNGFINGDMQVWQMGTSIVPSAANKLYTADMWKGIRETGANGLTNYQVPYNPIVAKQAMRVHRNLGDTQLNENYIAYVFTAEESKKYIGKPITVSFSARKGTDATGTYKARIKYNTSSETADFWSLTTLKEILFVPTTTDKIFSITSDTVIPDTYTQLCFEMVYIPLTPTAGANDYFEITNCNWSATDYYVPFSPKSFADELQDCMTYYEKSYSYATTPGTSTNVGLNIYHGCSDQNTMMRLCIPLKVKKRTIPTVTYFTSEGTVGSWMYDRYGVSKGLSNVYNDITNENVLGAYVATGATGATWVPTVISGHWVADARI